MKKDKAPGEKNFPVGRREFVLGTTAALLSPQLAFSEARPCPPYAQPEVAFNDNLAVPIPANPSLAGRGASSGFSARLAT